MSEPTFMVSVLIPVYNASAYLRQCLDSVVNQTYSHLQIVIIDDGSIDNSFVLCQEYTKLDTRVELYHQENQGVAITRNNLLEKVRGDYVLFIDADDWVESDMVESLVDLAKTHNADIVNCQNVINDSECNKNSIQVEIWNQDQSIYQFLRHKIFNGALWNKLIRAETLSGVRFQSKISFGEDALFCWQVLQRTQKVARTSNQYYHYRMNSTSLSHSAWTPEKKGSNHIVWEQITNDTALLWPEYIDIAKVRAALEDMWALYYAAQAGYEYNEHIYIRQRSVRENIWRILKSDIPSTNMKLYSTVASLSYWLLKYIHR